MTIIIYQTKIQIIKKHKGEAVMIHIYTDGSVVDNDDILPGYGWAFYIPELEFEYSKKVTNIDTNIARMELSAIRGALSFINTHPGKYMIHCDNEGIVDQFKGIATRKGNRDIWREIYILLASIKEQHSSFDITFLNKRELNQKSKTIKYSRYVDRLAYEQANNLPFILSN